MRTKETYACESYLHGKFPSGMLYYSNFKFQFECFRRELEPRLKLGCARMIIKPAYTHQTKRSLSVHATF